MATLPSDNSTANEHGVDRISYATPNDPHLNQQTVRSSTAVPHSLTLLPMQTSTGSKPLLTQAQTTSDILLMQHQAHSGQLLTQIQISSSPVLTQTHSPGKSLTQTKTVSGHLPAQPQTSDSCLLIGNLASSVQSLTQAQASCGQLHAKPQASLTFLETLSNSDHLHVLTSTGVQTSPGQQFTQSQRSLLLMDTQTDSGQLLAQHQTSSSQLDPQTQTATWISPLLAQAHFFPEPLVVQRESVPDSSVKQMESIPDPLIEQDESVCSPLVAEARFIPDLLLEQMEFIPDPLVDKPVTSIPDPLVEPMKSTAGAFVEQMDSSSNSSVVHVKSIASPLVEKMEPIPDALVEQSQTSLYSLPVQEQKCSNTLFAQTPSNSGSLHIETQLCDGRLKLGKQDIRCHSPRSPEASQAILDLIPAKTQRHPMKVLLLYCKDPALARCSQLDSAYWRSEEQYCNEVQDLADLLLMFSLVEEDGQCCRAFTCVYDVYDNAMVNNWLMWTENQLNDADCVLLACSPTLYASLQSSSSIISMQKARCVVSSLANIMAEKPFYPVFLNMPVQRDWIPTQLKNTYHFQLNISAFHDAIGNINGLDEEVFGWRACQCFESDSQFADLLSLLRMLRHEFSEPPEPPSKPIALPSLRLTNTPCKRSSCDGEPHILNKKPRMEIASQAASDPELHQQQGRQVSFPSLNFDKIDVPALFFQHQQDFSLVDFDALLPHLNVYSLLTDAEIKYLANLDPSERKVKLAELMASKDPSGLRSFLCCLADEKQHSGNIMLLDILLNACKSGSWNSLVKHMKSVYLSEDWLGEPYFECKKFVNLALVTAQKVTFEDVQTDKFIRHTLHGSIDDVEYKKKRITMDEIFSFISKKENKDVKAVVVQGAPGIGKTLLARCMCQKWAKGEILTEYELLFFIPLRAFPANCGSLSLRDLVELYFCGPDADSMERELFARDGKKVLLILEGWDELPPNLRGEFTLFNELVLGVCKKLLKASVMVTSRPIVVEELYKIIKDRQIEVLGFKEKQIKEYIEHNLGAGKAQEVWKYLQNTPAIKAFAHIPLTLRIICEVVKKLSVLPETETQLYEKFIYHTILRELSKMQPKEYLERIKSLDNYAFMEEVKSTIGPLSTLALEGFKQKKFVFTADDLSVVGLDPSLQSVGLGLLNCIPSFMGKGSMCGDHTAALEHDEVYRKLYQFKHLTVQEYLASLHIASLDHEEQAALLKCYRHDKQFYNVWKFFAGISKLQGDKCKTLVSKANQKDSKDALFLYHWLYEAHTADACQKAGEELECRVDLSNPCKRLNVVDCLCIAYVVASSGDLWSLDLRGCELGAKELEVFRKHFEETETQLRIEKLILSGSRLKGKAVDSLISLLRGRVPITELDIGANPCLKDDIVAIAEAVKDIPSLKVLHLSNNKLTPKGMHSLAGLLMGECYLETLFIGHDKQVGDRGVRAIAAALPFNTSLKELCFQHVGVGAIGLQALVVNMPKNHSVEILRLSGNRFTQEDCGAVCSILQCVKQLKILDISQSEIHDEGFIKILETLEVTPNSRLKRLVVGGCRLTNRSMAKFANFLASTDTLEAIHLGSNDIGEDGAKYLFRGIQQSRSLMEVLLENTGIHGEMRSKLEGLTGTRQDLVVTFISSYLQRKMLKNKKELGSDEITDTSS